MSRWDRCLAHALLLAQASAPGQAHESLPQRTKIRWQMTTRRWLRSHSLFAQNLRLMPLLMLMMLSARSDQRAFESRQNLESVPATMLVAAALSAMALITPGCSRLLVVGGSGYLGREVCRSAVKSGWSVTSLSRRGTNPEPESRSSLRSPGCRAMLPTRRCSRTVRMF